MLYRNQYMTSIEHTQQQITKHIKELLFLYHSINSVKSQALNLGVCSKSYSSEYLV
jgi:hypothetical protein